MLLSTWVLLAAGLVFSFPMIYSRVKNHTELEDEILYVYFLSVIHCCCYIKLIFTSFLEYGWTTLATWSRLTRLHTTECEDKTVDVLLDDVRQ